MAFKTHINNASQNQPGQVDSSITATLTEGVVDKVRTDFKVEQNGTPNMSVNVLKGDAYVGNDAYVYGTQDQRFWPVSSSSTENVVIAANGSGNPRIDIICLKVDDSVSPGVQGVNASSVIAVTGTAAASPVAPAVPDDHLLLAQIAVANGASSITTANITDKRNTANVQNVILEDGGMLNGQISVSVATSDLTVSILTMNGETPSASNPVQIRVGNEIYKITAALTKTLNDGTNWFNLGSAELATQLANLFVYAIVRSGAIVLGYSRRPDGLLYSDFSGTSTSENYIATSTTPSASDVVRVIGRFSATLSASAAYTWSISGTGDVRNYPIFRTDDLTWAPTLVGFSSAPTSTIYKYRIFNDQVEILFIQGADGTSNTTGFTATLPFTIITLSNYRGTFPCEARDNGSDSATPGRAIFLTGVNTITFNKDYSGAAWTGSGSKRVRTTGWVKYDI